MSDLNKQLIETIKGNIPKKSSIPDTIMDIIPMSQEAIYRRLRGEVQFSFEEAAQIAQSMNFSLDEISSTSGDNERILFNVESTSYLSLTEKYLKTFEGLTGDVDLGHTNLNYVIALTPFTSVGKYEQLSKLYYYKWLYENRPIGTATKKFSETIVPEEVLNVHKKATSVLNQVNQCIIFSDSIIEAWIKDVQYFESFGLLEASEIEQLKNEYHEVLDELAVSMIGGYLKDGANLTVYLANVYFTATYGYCSSNLGQYAFAKTYAMNYLRTTNPRLYKLYEKGFETLKSYSTLISKSGVIERNTYIKKQHNLLDKL